MAVKPNVDKQNFERYDAILQDGHKKPSQVQAFADRLFGKMAETGGVNGFSFSKIGVPGSLFYRIKLVTIVDLKRTKTPETLGRDVEVFKALICYSRHASEHVASDEKDLVDSRIGSLWLSLVQRSEYIEHKATLWSFFFEHYLEKPSPRVMTLLQDPFSFSPKEREPLLLYLIRAGRVDVVRTLVDTWGDKAFLACKNLLLSSSLALDDFVEILPAFPKDEQEHLLTTFLALLYELRDFEGVNTFIRTQNVSKLPIVKDLASEYCRLFPEEYFNVSHLFFPGLLRKQVDETPVDCVTIERRLPGVCTGLAIQRYGKKKPDPNIAKMLQLRYLMEKKLARHPYVNINKFDLPDGVQIRLENVFGRERSLSNLQAMKLFYLRSCSDVELEDLSRRYPVEGSETIKEFGIDRVEVVEEGPLETCIYAIFSNYDQGEFYISLKRDEGAHRLYLSLDEFVIGDNTHTACRESLSDVKRALAWRLGGMCKKRGYNFFTLRKITRTPLAFLKHKLEIAECALPYDQKMHELCYFVNTRAKSDVVGRAFVEYNRLTGDGINPHVDKVDAAPMISNPLLLLACLK